MLNAASDATPGISPCLPSERCQHQECFDAYDSDLRFPIRALPSDSSYLVHPDTFDFYIDI